MPHSQRPSVNNPSRTERAYGYLAVGFLLTAGLLPAVILGFDLVADAICAPSAHSLRVPDMDLGTLEPGEHRTGVLRLQNLGWRRLRLESPRTTCGCVLVDSGRITLAARSSVELRFTLHAPDRPGVLANIILLQSLDFPGLCWSPVVRARVFARAWAQPRSVSLRMGPDGSGNGHTVVRIASNEKISSVTSELSRVDLRVRHVDQTTWWIGVRYALSPADQKETVDTIRVRAGGIAEQEILRIPVQWGRVQSLACIPKRLDLGTELLHGESFERTLVVAKGTVSGNITATPLCPWVRVVERQQKARVLRLRLRFDTSQIPSDVSKPVLRLGIGDGAPALEIRAYADRFGT